VGHDRLNRDVGIKSGLGMNYARHHWSLIILRDVSILCSITQTRDDFPGNNARTSQETIPYLPG
jgi:hypothetical protein